MKKPDFLAWITAWSYDPLIGRALSSLRRRVDRELTDGPAGRILDLCCGTGEQVGRLCAQGLNAWGADINPHMLRQSHRHAKGRFISMDAKRLALRSGSMEAVILSMALHEKRPALREEMIRETVRVLKPGGTLLVADYDPSEKTGRATWSLIVGIERIAGREHYACFRDFLNRGGLDPLFRTTPLTLDKVFLCCDHSIVLRRYRLR